MLININMDQLSGSSGERDVVSLFRIGLLMRGSAFTLLAWLVIILNNARQLFDFLGTAQHSALRARLHRGHAGHG